jgi:hypothetical protein
MHCWNGNHRRCTGWCVIPDESNRGRVLQLDQSIMCECWCCVHQPIPKLHHLQVTPTKGGGPWSSLTTTPS